MDNFTPKSNLFSDPKSVDQFIKNYQGILKPECAVKVWDEITARQERQRERSRYNR